MHCEAFGEFISGVWVGHLGKRRSNWIKFGKLISARIVLFGSGDL